MERLKKIFVVLFFMSIFVFASCKNSYTPEQVKADDNSEKEETIKCFAKISTERMREIFVPKGTKIRVRYGSLERVEYAVVSDDKGRFEIRKPLLFSETKFVLSFYYREKEYGCEWFYSKDVSYCVECIFTEKKSGLKTKIKGVAKREGVFVPKGTVIQVFDGTEKLEDMIVDDDEGHFESSRWYSFDLTEEIYRYSLEIKEGRVTHSSNLFYPGEKVVSFAA